MSLPTTATHRWIFLTLISAAVGGCVAADADSSSAKPKQLYFALELLKDGRKIGSPQLLGFEGRQVVAERRAPGKPQPDYRLLLRPRESGPGYKVVLEVVLPSGKRLAEVVVMHGEEQRVQLGDATELKVLLMRVDSPEFKAWMQLKPPGDGDRGTI